MNPCYIDNKKYSRYIQNNKTTLSLSSNEASIKKAKVLSTNGSINCQKLKPLHLKPKRARAQMKKYLSNKSKNLHTSRTSSLRNGDVKQKSKSISQHHQLEFKIEKYD